jgi:hypothetical protein
MRFDKPIYFQRTTPGEYDATTGDYGADTVKETHRFADVTDSGVETLKLIYGELKQGVKTIRLLNHYNEPFDHIRIGNKTYKVDFERKLRTKHVFVAHEVQRGKD